MVVVVVVAGVVVVVVVAVVVGVVVVVVVVAIVVAVAGGVVVVVVVEVSKGRGRSRSSAKRKQLSVNSCIWQSLMPVVVVIALAVGAVAVVLVRVFVNCTDSVIATENNLWPRVITSHITRPITPATKSNLPSSVTCVSISSDGRVACSLTVDPNSRYYCTSAGPSISHMRCMQLARLI